MKVKPGALSSGTFGSATGEALIGGAVEALVAQTRAVERAVAALALEPIAIEGSDSLDNPNAVFQ